MNGRLLLSLIAVFSFSSTLSHAAVFERDWEDAPPGNGLLTFDDVNQREWLDVPLTILADYPGGLNGVLAELESGGDFEDFTWATRDDVFDLAESAGIDPNETSLAVNETATRNLIQLLGPTDVLSGGRVGTVGMLDESSSANEENRLVAVFQVTPQINLAEVTVVPFFSLADDSPGRFTGVMLYRQIPEPSSLFLVLTYFLLIGYRIQ